MPLSKWAMAAFACLGTLCAFQRPFRQYPGVEYENFELPPDWKQPAEWAFARLMFPPAPGARFAFRGPEWEHGASTWTNDYPRSDRHFLVALRRLTRIDARSVEQPVNLKDGDDVYNWPWLYAVQAGGMNLTDSQVAKLRDYLERGGFLMADDFWGTLEWRVFAYNMQRVFPGRAIVEIANSDPIFHSIYDLDDRHQIPGAWSIGGPPYLDDGIQAHWWGIYDDRGRILIAATHNSDIGDSWEWADDPRYPEKYSALGIRITANYVMYALTH